jgi:hypothetical protein
MIAIDQLPPEIQALVGQYANRSPVRAPLTDLRTPQNPRDRLNRPTFFFEMGQPNPSDQGRYLPYPALRYKLVNGVPTERRVDSEIEDLQVQRQGWSDVPIHVTPLTVDQQHAADLAALQEAVAGLSADDRQRVVEAQKQDRLDLLHQKLADLPEATLALVLGLAPTKGKK